MSDHYNPKQDAQEQESESQQKIKNGYLLYMRNLLNSYLKAYSIPIFFVIMTLCLYQQIVISNLQSDLKAFQQRMSNIEQQINNNKEITLSKSTENTYYQNYIGKQTQVNSSDIKDIQKILKSQEAVNKDLKDKYILIKNKQKNYSEKFTQIEIDLVKVSSKLSETKNVQGVYNSFNDERSIKIEDKVGAQTSYFVYLGLAVFAIAAFIIISLSIAYQNNNQQMRIRYG